MIGISLNPPEDLSDSLTDLAKTNRPTRATWGQMVLRDYIEHEKETDRQIEQAVKEADKGKFVTDEQVAVMRTRR